MGVGEVAAIGTAEALAFGDNDGAIGGTYAIVVAEVAV
jgi:hypothetical protein